MFTAHFAGGGAPGGDESAWIAYHLAQLRLSTDEDPGADLSFKDLKNIYLGARIVVGSVVASQLALPAVIEAGTTVREATFPSDLASFAEAGAAQTELFLSGARGGRRRESNDYPAVVKTYIAAIAGMLNAPYDRAFARLEAERPDLWALGLDADELQRLCWGHLRRRIDEVVPAERLATFRAMPLREGTDALLAHIKELTGVVIPPRILQRDSQDYVDPRANWRAALEEPRQDPRIAFLSGIRFAVENAEIATSYCLGSTLMRMNAGMPAEAVLRQQVRFGVQDIAAGTRMVTHNARFQSRRGARPDYWRSFEELLRNVRLQAGQSPVLEDGRIDWFDTHASQIKGWCPAQNRYAPKDPVQAEGTAERGTAAVAAWQDHAKRTFRAVPEYAQPTVGELLASVVLFTVLHEDSPLRPGSAFMRELADRL